ncbi:hypothetical protein [Hasllibacter sp. MH4015]|uniref:hypothetical protein n=1 Tax=Hasllibacter sp. MH4015 TaxID=2854029 RepID=UPI001CD3F5CC|nr:hypothetical protein [Hasllibacter sp. MH4015]
MKRVILHVGLGKTGTRTIQTTLAQDRALLPALGLAYPGNKVAHHDLLAMAHAAGPAHFWFRKRGIGPTQAALACQRMIDTIEGEMARDTPTILLSSEYFQALRPDALAALDTLFAGHGYRLETLCYVREPFGHLASRYQQAVKMSHRRLADLFAQPYQPWAKRHLSSALKALGRDRVHVRRMERAQRGLTRDVLAVAGVTPPPDMLHDQRENTGLCRDAVYLLDALNGADGPDRPLKTRHYATIAAMQGEKFTLPPCVAEALTPPIRSEKIWLNRTFGIRYPMPDLSQGSSLDQCRADAMAALDSLTRTGRVGSGWPLQAQARSA